MTSTATAPLRGLDLLRATINQITQHPECWGQEHWHSHCGTRHCFAGWSQVLAGLPARSKSACVDAQAALEITDRDAAWAFAPLRTLTELFEFSRSKLAGEEFFDRAEQRLPLL